MFLEGNGSVTFEIKKGDTAEPLKGQCQDENRDPIDVTSKDVKLSVVSKKGDVIVDQELMTKVDASKGIVKYDFSQSEIDSPGLYDYEVEIIGADGKVTLPSRGYNQMYIDEELIS